MSPSFAVAVKLNSADFQRGGFDADDAAQGDRDARRRSASTWSSSPAAATRARRWRAARPTVARAAREAYFLELAAELAKTSPLPLMLTGGITRRETAEQVLASGVALVGMGTAIAVTPDLPDRWRAGREATERLQPVAWSDKTLASAASMALVRHQMRRITRGQHPTGGTHPVHALVCDQRAQRRALRRYRAWLEARS